MAKNVHTGVYVYAILTLRRQTVLDIKLTLYWYHNTNEMCCGGDVIFVLIWVNVSQG
jgi:hypothetical protein